MLLANSGVAFYDRNFVFFLKTLRVPHLEGESLRGSIALESQALGPESPGVNPACL